ncbi:MAG: metallophosphoesterase family protein [Nitrospirae bacterium]|nr:metallophosphoesterase family protein [Candidatus Manganitrophaceae bacterium]
MALRATRIGVISDTHGRLDPKVLQIFAGVDHIIHAGDIGGEAVLKGLAQIAPVIAVRGNNDVGPPLNQLPDLERIAWEGREIVLIHNLKDYLKPTEAMKQRLRGVAPRVVISGHSHKGMVEQREEVIYFNPGGAGPKRFSLRRSVGMMERQEETVRFSLIFLEEGRPLRRRFPLPVQPGAALFKDQTSMHRQ